MVVFRFIYVIMLLATWNLRITCIWEFGTCLLTHACRFAVDLSVYRLWRKKRAEGMAEPALSRVHSVRERLVDNLSAHRNELVALFSRSCIISSNFLIINFDVLEFSRTIREEVWSDFTDCFEYEGLWTKERECCSPISCLLSMKL